MNAGTEKPPDYTVMCDSRLVAYIWLGPTDKLVSNDGPHTEICEVPFGRIVSFDRGAEETLVTLLGSSEDIDAFVFKLGMEEFDVEPGHVVPTGHVRRF